MRLILAALLTAFPAIAVAQSGEPPQRIRNIQLGRGEACPKAAPGEVVVCSTLEEPYRVPKAFRDTGPVPTSRQSWVNRASDIDQTSRVAGGLPNTCSPVGNGGQTGCFSAYGRGWAAERKARVASDGSGSTPQ